MDSRYPDAAGSILASIAVSEVGWFTWDELFAVHWVVSEDLEESPEVGEG